MQYSRRQFAKNLATGLILGAPAYLSARAAAGLPQSIAMQLGPFYPVHHETGKTTDLTRLKGHTDRAKGTIMYMQGRVLKPDGSPVPNAKIELWQANAAGKYSHKGDKHDLPLDPNFEGYGNQRTDGQGRYSFITIRPGSYPLSTARRAAHIHLDVQGADDRLITQMYFKDDPLLAQDPVLASDLAGGGIGSSPLPDHIFGKIIPASKGVEAGAVVFNFDIVLANG